MGLTKHVSPHPLRCLFPPPPLPPLPARLPAGEVLALYHYREAERLEGPAVVGESVLLQEHEAALRVHPCTWRTLTPCTCWMIRCRDFKPVLALRPGLHNLVKARALQSLDERVHRVPLLNCLPALR